jgi:hypothetical protein
MKTTSAKTQAVKVLGLILCLGALPLAMMVTGCTGDRYHQSTGEAIDDQGISIRLKSALSNVRFFIFSSAKLIQYESFFN